MAAFAQPTADEALVSEALKAVSLPKGVNLTSIFFDKDYAGDRALRVVFSVSKKIPLSAARLRALSHLDQKVSDALRPLEMGAMAYVRFLDAA